MGEARRRVLGPGEEVPPEEFYTEHREGLDARLALNRTALREAERKFKGADYQRHLPEVLDFDRPEEHLSIRQVGTIAEGHDYLKGGAPIYEVEGIPGFKFVPGALATETQSHWLQRTFHAYMGPPNTTSLTAHYEVPGNIFTDDCDIFKKATSKPVGDREALARKMRWVTLGHQYDWTSKEYDFSREPCPFPKDLASLSKATVSALFPHLSSYQAEAGIVNYYQVGDTLTSHVDRSELNMRAPLLSLSFGLTAIFLVGGRGRDDPVRAMFLRSGDLSVLSGDCRHCFHGIPRILRGTLPDHLQTVEDPIVRRYIKDARININIRQVSV